MKREHGETENLARKFLHEKFHYTFNNSIFETIRKILGDIIPKKY